MKKHYKMLKQYFSNQTKRTQYITATLVVLVVAGIGTYLLIGSHAATPYASITADKGTLSGGAVSQSCTGASDGNCVVFGSGSGSTGIYWGAYLNGRVTYASYYGNPAPNGQNWQDAPWGNTGNTWDRFESNAGKKVSILHYGQPNPWLQTTWYGNVADIITGRGAIPWVDMDSNSTSLSDIANGVHDSSIKTWADNVKAWGKPLFLRWDWEMNGNWFNWGQQATANPAAFVQSWRHFHDVVANEGASNVTWVWCPNNEWGHGPSYASLYPGDSYVDWTCLDGYNKSTSSQSFASLYQQSYNDLLAVAPTKPIAIGEVSSLEYASGVKANWITDALGTQLPTNFSKVKAVLWFNWRFNECDVVCGYQSFPIESSTSAQAAFARAIANPYYASNNYGNLPLGSKVRPLP